VLGLSVELRFHPEALAELRKSADFYVARSSNASHQFAEKVDLALVAILAEPRRFLAIGSHERARTVEGFPFQVIYRILGEVIFVVAIAHTSRRPGYWKRRR
jgi:toxin ParE1/3/4